VKSQATKRRYRFILALEMALVALIAAAIALMIIL
jgi:hypothetical protein